MRAEITEGATPPDYELPDHTDTPRKLSFQQGDDHKVRSKGYAVMMYRAGEVRSFAVLDCRLRKSR